MAERHRGIPEQDRKCQVAHTISHLAHRLGIHPATAGSRARGGEGTRLLHQTYAFLEPRNLDDRSIRPRMAMFDAKAMVPNLPPVPPMNGLENM